MIKGRQNLPIQVSDRTWDIFKEIIKIKNVEIEYDPTWNNNSVSKNVKAQYWILPSEFRFGITIYDQEVTEETLIHEALHSKFIAYGYPFLYPTKFPVKKEIYNLYNSIDHLEIFNFLENLGFTPRLNARAKWESNMEVLGKFIDNFPPHATSLTFKILGAIETFGALNLKIKKDIVKSNLHFKISSGFNLGMKIFYAIKEFDLLKKDEKFDALLKICSLIGFTKEDLFICKIDFERKKRLYFNPENGVLMEIR